MTTRLPVVPARGPAVPPSRLDSAEPRVAIQSPPFLAIASDDLGEAALRFASALLRALHAGGAEVEVVVEAGARRAADRLVEAGATAGIELPSGELEPALRRVLSNVPPHTLVIAIGETFVARCAGLLRIWIGTSGVGTDSDLVLSAPSEPVASAIGGWLAQRVREEREALSSPRG